MKNDIARVRVSMCVYACAHVCKCVSGGQRSTLASYSGIYFVLKQGLSLVRAEGHQVPRICLSLCPQCHMPGFLLGHLRTGVWQSLSRLNYLPSLILPSCVGTGTQGLCALSLSFNPSSRFPTVCFLVCWYRLLLCSPAWPIQPRLALNSW